MRRFIKSTVAAAVVSMTSVVAPTSATAGSDPFVGEMMFFGGTFCPIGWAEANGALLAVSSNDALFSLLGTIYGGDGRTTFGLPDLRGRMPVHQGSGPGLSPRRIGAKGGAETTTLLVNNLASHNHIVNATNNGGDKAGPGTDYLADPVSTITGQDVRIYSTADANRQMSTKMIGDTGSNAPFNIKSPFLGVRACMALFGVYPSRN